MGERTDAIPSVADIDTSWMTRALHEAGVAGDAEIIAMTATSIGTGQVGENVRFELTWDRADPALPTSVVGKFPTSNAEHREAVKAVGTYAREAGFYRDARPLVTISTPDIHRLDWDDDTHEFVLLMNDLRASVAGDQLRGCTPEQAEIVVDQAVGLHAPTWGRTDELLGFDWVGFPDDERTAGMAMLLGWALEGFLERFAERLSADDLAVGEQLVGSYARWRELVDRWAADGGEWCLVHGDYRLDNLLFGTTPSCPPVTVVDWQTASVDIGPADIAYFVGAGLLPDERAAHERGLVERYAQGMRSAGIDLDDDTAWDGYVLGSPGGYLMAVIASQLVEQTERGDEMFAVMAERHAAQIRDVGLLGLL